MRNKSYAERMAEAAEKTASAAMRSAFNPGPYANEPNYIEGRLDYFNGVSYQTYSESSSRLWCLGFMEAAAQYPNFHRDFPDGLE